MATWSKSISLQATALALAVAIAPYALGQPANGVSPEVRPIPDPINRRSVVITLVRQGCLGQCPAYRIELHGDGEAVYEGLGFTVISGKHTSQISPELVRNVFLQAQRADFFNAAQRGTVDGPTARVSVASDGYELSAQAFNRTLVRLADEIDRAADSEKWVKGNDDTITALKREHWDFAGQDDTHQSLIVGIMQYGGTPLLRGLLAEGAKVNGSVAEMTCATILRAIERDQLDRIQVLLDLGAPVEWRQSPTLGINDPACLPLFQAAEQGKAETVDFLLAHGANPNSRNGVKATPLISIARRGTVSGADYERVIAALVAAGGDVDATDEDGSTALMALMYNGSSPEIARVLIRAGANVNATNIFGKTALDYATVPELQQLLLEYHANRGRRG